jgi:hypothetical protein
MPVIKKERPFRGRIAPSSFSTEYSGHAEQKELKKVSVSFLNSLVGLLTHDAKELVTESGFKPFIIDHGHLVAQTLINDIIHLWKSQDGDTIYQAVCFNTCQVIEDI